MARVFLCNYQTDDGNGRCIELDQSRANAASFTGAAPSSGPPMPLHGRFVRVRGVYGRNAGGVKMFLPCPTKAVQDTLWTAGTFTVVPYATFQITGRRGERQTATIPLP